MIKRLTDAPAAVIDLWIYVAIGFFTAFSVALGTDDAGRYMNLETLFWCKTGCGCLNASLLAAKMFRSTAFADHLKKKEDTAFIAQNRPAP